jgi:AcrR family transcriptional regulator
MAKDSGERVDCGSEMIRKTAASKVFETARDLFYRRGIRAVGVDEIVCEAGVTKPVVYSHYPTKDIVFLECVRRARTELELRIREPEIMISAGAGVEAVMEQREAHTPS